MRKVNTARRSGVDVRPVTAPKSFNKDNYHFYQIIKLIRSRSNKNASVKGVRVWNILRKKAEYLLKLP